MSKLFRAIRILIWLPFAAACNTPFLVVLNLGVAFLDYHLVILTSLLCTIVAASVKPLEARLRPAGRTFGPPRVKPLIAGLVKAVRKDKAPSPRASASSRGLSPQLRALLRRPADQKPAAMLFEEQKKADKTKAEHADAA